MDPTHPLGARSCLQLKHQVADLERETLRAREERKEELSSARKRMECRGQQKRVGVGWKVG
jgi:hypothetical protein